jgi:hypothetical protein
MTGAAGGRELVIYLAVPSAIVLGLLSALALYLRNRHKSSRK